MSVHKSIKCDALGKNVKKAMLETTLKELGIGLDYKVDSVMNKYGTSKVDAGFIKLKNNEHVSLGVKFNQNGGVTLEGDIYLTSLGFHGGEQQLMNKIAQTYQKNVVTKTLKGKGAIIKSNTVDNEGNILLHAIQY